MTASGGGRGVGHVLLIGITQTADARVKKVVGTSPTITSLFADRVSSSLKIQDDKGDKQVRQLRSLLKPGLRTSQLLVIVLPYASVRRELDEELDGLLKRGATVERLVKGADRLPTTLRAIDQSAHDAMSEAVLASLRRHGIGVVQAPQVETGPDASRRQVKLKLLQGLARHKKWGRDCHSSEDDFWKSRGKNLPSADCKAIEKELIDAGLIGTKVNDGDNGQGLRYFLRPENKGLLVASFPELKPYV